jgi:Family of unknown function (DUF6528)
MRRFLGWIGWSYIGFFIVWLVLRSLLRNYLWALLLVNAVVDYLFVPLPILLIASLLFRRWRLLLGLGIPAIAFGLLVGIPSLFPFPEAQKNTIPLPSQIGTAEALLVCGSDEVFALKLTPNPEKPAKVWSWRAATSPNLPKLITTKFATTDECKPIEQGRKVLITSSTNGVALVEQVTGRTLFYASVSGAHSAELLPSDRVVVTGSESLIGGHTLELFDVNTSNRPLWKTELYSGHGVYWDQVHKVLWALGRYELRQYELARWESKTPELKLRQSFPLPSPGGHDLSPASDQSALYITTDTDVVLFDLQSNLFSSDPRMKQLALVKSIDVHPVTKRLAYVQAEGGHWWSSRIHVLEPDQAKASQTILLAGERLYKARWIH